MINLLKYFTLIFFISLVNVSKAQTLQLKDINADLSGAIEIKNSKIGPTSAPNGYGNIMEVTSFKTNPKSIEKEHNTVWYKFKPEKSCLLSFDLIPISTKDDYDFMLFETQNPNPKSIKDLRVIRTNIARNNEQIGKLTGLNKSAKNEFVAQGPNPRYSKAVFVDSSKIYYLLIDNVYENGSGHSLILKYTDCIEAKKKEIFSLNINIFEESSNQSVAANIYIIDKSDSERNYDTTEFKNTSSVFFEMDTMKFYEILVKSENHLRYKDIFKNYGREKVLRKDIYLQGVSEGSSLIFEDIYFFGGNDVFKPESRPALTRLLNIMKDNPSLAIEIQGHVNQPLNKAKDYSDEYYSSLSERRAKAVYDYLSKRGIEEKRLRYKGFGNSKMLFPYATSTDEMQKNRRVEILILDF